MSKEENTIKINIDNIKSIVTMIVGIIAIITSILQVHGSIMDKFEKHNIELLSQRHELENIKAKLKALEKH